MAETATLTLTDFLLTRIAEERAGLGRTLGHAPLGRGGRLVEVIAPGAVRRRQESRAFELAFELDALAFEVRQCRRAGGDGSDRIRHLARVYADHPDYRQEWKP